MRALRKGDVIIVDLTQGSGREQSGIRPAVAVSGAELPGVIVVIPLTGTIEALRFANTLALLPDKDNGLSQESVALIFHVRSVDKNRVVRTIGKVDTATRKKIDIALKKMLRL
ncbi:MAG TPA: type II toxin-antitoxin system PemK/MazF family toxin [Candidatus Paceibacterota bacterium]